MKKTLTAILAATVMIVSMPQASASTADTMVKVTSENTTCSGSMISPSWAIVTGRCVSGNKDIAYTVTTQGDTPLSWSGEIVRDYNFSVALVNIDGVYEGDIEPLSVSTQELGAWIAEESGYTITEKGIVDNGPVRNGVAGFFSKLWKKLTG